MESMTRQEILEKFVEIYKAQEEFDKFFGKGKDRVYTIQTVMEQFGFNAEEFREVYQKETK